MEPPDRNYTPFELAECVMYDIQFNLAHKARVEILFLFDRILLCNNALLAKYVASS